MEVQTLELLNFRNYEHTNAAFDGGLNVVAGANGQGKTNLLEAIHLLSALGSHRVSSLAPLVMHGRDEAIVRGTGTARNRPVRLDAQVRREGGLRILVNRATVERGSDAAGILASVLFSPEDLALVKAGPEERRRFLDQAAARVRPGAGAERHEFERVLRQRNGVLKAAAINPRAKGHLDVWTEQLATAAAAVVRSRLLVLDSVAGPAAARYLELAVTGPAPELAYEATWRDDGSSTEIEEDLIKSFAQSLGRDLDRGTTTTGPHRDDLKVTLGDVDARIFASQGEQRSLALSLRLAERDVLTEVKGEPPILLLDDVFSELDEHRRACLAELVTESGQTIATTTSVEGLPLKGGRTINVSAGRLVDA